VDIQNRLKIVQTNSISCFPSNQTFFQKLADDASRRFLREGLWVVSDGEETKDRFLILFNDKLIVVRFVYYFSYFSIDFDLI